LIHPDQSTLLSSGEAITAAEVFEGLIRLAQANTEYPLLSSKDRILAVLATAVEALEWAKEKGIVS